MRKTNKKLLKEYPFFHFKNSQEFQDFLQTNYEGKSEKIDYIDIGGILYTMDEYDMDGKTITYGNKRTGLLFQIETSNRYGENGFADAIVLEPYELGVFRNDINYAD